MQKISIYITLLSLLCLGNTFAAELNPYFKKSTKQQQLTPLTQKIREQIERGCVSAYQGKRPLADRYDLRHGKPQIRSSELFRVASAITIGDPTYEQAKHWLQSLLTTSNDPQKSYAAYTVLLTHGIRKIVENKGATNFLTDLHQAQSLSSKLNLNQADLLFWEAVSAQHDGKHRTALELSRAARHEDKWFYNAYLLELELLLATGKASRFVSTTHCTQQANAVLELSISLFDLDTCPRHAVLLLNWLRAQYKDITKDAFGQLVRAYVSALLGNRAAFDHIFYSLKEPRHLRCYTEVSAILMQTLKPLFEKK